jgi:molecular chaperone GrpE
MSGEPNQDDQKPAADEGQAAEIPVEVVAPGNTAEAQDPVSVLEAKVATLEKDAKDNKDRWLRAAADLENTRKRTKREIDDAKFETKNKVLKEMLPVVDNLERAIEHVGTEVDAKFKPFIEGVQLVLRQFTTAFERLEVTVIDALNQPFDPNLHEAISQQESDQPPGTIIQVLQRGYRAGDRLLRPALVVVAKAKPAEA